MGGAAYLSGLAAYRSGAGLVRIVTPEENIPIIQTLLPQAIVTGYDGTAGRTVSETEIREWITWADAVVIGPGISKSAAAEAVLRAVLTYRNGKKTVLDADALNLLADHQELMEELDRKVREHYHLTGGEKEDVQDSGSKSPAAGSEKGSAADTGLSGKGGK